jgi:hypothetical protein
MWNIFALVSKIPSPAQYGNPILGHREVFWFSPSRKSWARALNGYQIRVHSKRERGRHPAVQLPPSSLPMINKRKAGSSLCPLTPNRRRGGESVVTLHGAPTVRVCGGETVRGDGSVYPYPKICCALAPPQDLSSFAPFP